MSNGRAKSGAPETVLAGGGTTARFDGSRLRIVRGRTTWTLPLTALKSAELSASGAVRIEISGAPGEARHGLGPAVDLRAPNSHAAKAFLGQLTTALAAAGPRAADGHALVRMTTQTRRPLTLGAGGLRAVKISTPLLLYALLLFVLGLASPREEAGITLTTLGVGGVLGLVGGILLWRVGRRVRSLWLLRKRGVGVVGEVTGYVRIWTRGGHLWKFSRMDFTTVDGHRMRDVPSVVTTWGLSDNAWGGAQVELNYDPANPLRASRHLTIGFVFRTLLLAAVATVPTTVSALCILVNLPV